MEAEHQKQAAEYREWITMDRRRIRDLEDRLRESQKESSSLDKQLIIQSVWNVILILVTAAVLGRVQ